MDVKSLFLGAAASVLVAGACATAEPEPPEMPPPAPPPPAVSPATPPEPAQQPIPPTNEVKLALQGYADWVNQFDPAQMDRSHTYAADGLRRLSFALQALNRAAPAPEDAQIRERMTPLDRAADRLTEDPRSMEHADMVRDAFLAAADVLDRLADRHTPPDAALKARITALRQASTALSPEARLLQQRDAVARLFRDTVPLLEELGGLRPAPAR
jgi:hypothetical protein